MSSGGCLIGRFIIGHNSLNGRKKKLRTIHFCRLVTDSISKKIGYVVNNMAAILSNVQETGLQISISSLKRRNSRTGYPPFTCNLSASYSLDNMLLHAVSSALG